MSDLLHTIEKVPKDKHLIIFDVDGTLTKSKTPVESEMALLFTQLLEKHKAAIIGGASFEQFQIQFLNKLPNQSAISENLFAMPLDGGAFYQNKEGKWQKVYQKDFSPEEKAKVFKAFELAFKDTGYLRSYHTYGEQIEDRGSVIAFSALGQHAPLEEKNEWLLNHPTTRAGLVLKLREYLPEMEVQEAGITSIDVTLGGVDKKFGIEQLLSYLKMAPSDALFIGDDFKSDGNDFPATESGVMCFQVTSPDQTKELIKYLLAK